MNKTAYHTGTIELMPYTEHGEFCIVGVFAVDAQSRSLSYKILDQRRTKRLTGFFPEVERTIFTQTLKSVHQEWKALHEMVNDGAGTAEFDVMAKVPGSDLFTAITYPREGMIRHKARGVILTADIDAWLEQTFKQMVMRRDMEAVLPEEQKLTREVAGYLKQLNFQKQWKERQVGNETYHAKFPFTHTPHNGEKVDRAIKPLFLGQKNTTKIMEHGDAWIQKVRRLNQFGLAPDTLVFPIERPANESGEQYEHADLIINDLKKEGVQIIEEMTIERFKPILTTEVVSDTPLFSQSEAG